MPRKDTEAFADEDDEPKFQISTMCDVLMCLLIFFVATANTEISQQIAEVTLPDSGDSDEVSKELGETVLNLFLNPFSGAMEIDIEGIRYKEAADITGELKSRKALAEKLGAGGQSYRVVIRADKEVPYKMVKEVMIQCGNLGIINVTFTTQKFEE
ncbi:MAG: biopolymer transporter ExbD [Verrucomicrobiota bacterium]